MNEQIVAPWTPEQVSALNAFQRKGMLHPFTCGNGCQTNLVATEAGWTCPANCGYTQDWAHAFMFDPRHYTGSPRLLELQPKMTTDPFTVGYWAAYRGLTLEGVLHSDLPLPFLGGEEDQHKFREVSEEYERERMHEALQELKRDLLNVRGA